MVATVTDLTTEVKNLTRSEGAALVDFAPVERFENAPKGHRPGDFIPKAKSVIAFGMRISDAIVDYNGYPNQFTGAAPRLGTGSQIKHLPIYGTLHPR